MATCPSKLINGRSMAAVGQEPCLVGVGSRKLFSQLLCQDLHLACRVPCAFAFSTRCVFSMGWTQPWVPSPSPARNSSPFTPLRKNTLAGTTSNMPDLLENLQLVVPSHFGRKQIAQSACQQITVLGFQTADREQELANFL